MSNNKLIVEVMNSIGAWVDVTTDVMGIQANGIGLAGARNYKSAIGKAAFVLKNTAKTYSPDLNTTLEVARKIRVKATGASLGKALQVVHSGLGATGYWSQTVTRTVIVGHTYVLTWQARAGFDSMYNTDIAGLSTNTSGFTGSTYTYTNKWTTYSYTLVIVLLAASIAPVFFYQNKTGGQNSLGIEYRNITLTDNGSADVLTNGNFATGAVTPWVNVDSASTTIIATTYPSSNQDATIPLRSVSGIVAPTTVDTAGVNTLQLGGVVSIQRWVAQSWRTTAINGGQLTQLSLYFDANVGSPAGGVTWEIHADAINGGGGNNPAAGVLFSGTFVPVPSSNNILTLSGGTILNNNSVTYWLVLRASIVQADDNYWTLRRNPGDPYSQGSSSYTDNGAVTWTPFTGNDLRVAMQVTSVVYDKIAEEFSVVSTVVSTSTVNYVKLYMSKSNVPVGTMTLRIETDSSGQPSGALVNVNATTTLAESGLNTFLTMTQFTFSTPFSVSTNTPYWIVLSTTRAASGADYVNIGEDLSTPAYAYSGATQVSSVYYGLGGTVIFEIGETGVSNNALTVINDYWTVFYGLIKDIAPAPFANAGTFNTVVTAVDLTSVLQNASADLALQKNQRMDQLFVTLLATLPQGVPTTTLPGSSVETGLSTFQKAFDGYQKHTTVLQDAMGDAVVSEYGRQWVDLDGTVRAVNRTFTPRRIVQPPALSVTGVAAGTTGAQSFDLAPLRSMDNIVNKAIFVSHPRQTGGAVQVLGQITTPLTLAPRTAIGVPSQTVITLTFRDIVTGKFIGGDSVVTPLVPDVTIGNSDLWVTDVIDANGVATGYNYTLYGPGAYTITNYVVAASQLTLTLNNYASGTLYVTKLQVRGLPIFTYDPVTVAQTDAASIALYQERAYSKDLVLLNDQNLAASMALYYLSQWKNPFTEATTLSVLNKATIGNVDLLSLGIGDLISVTDDQTGLSAIKHMIATIDYELDPTKTDYVSKWSATLERLDQAQYWILGDATYGVLGTTTKLYL